MEKVSTIAKEAPVASTISGMGGHNMEKGRFGARNTTCPRGRDSSEGGDRVADLAISSGRRGSLAVPYARSRYAHSPSERLFGVIGKFLQASCVRGGRLSFHPSVADEKSLSCHRS